MRRYDEMNNQDVSLPDFIIIGAAKSGTTSLHQYLHRHPQVFMSKLKEPEFFSDNSVFAKGISWYSSLFEDAQESQVCGESSTTYSRWPHTADAASRIAQTLPDVKLIYIMRHPVDRAYSHYAHHMRGGVTMTFEEALERDSIYVDCSMYMYQITRYLRYFRRESFLFLMSDDLRRDASRVLTDIQGFLGLRVMDITSNDLININVGGSDFAVCNWIVLKLQHIMPRVFPIMVKIIPKEWRNKILHWLNISLWGRRLNNDLKLQAMRPETRINLIQRFEKPNKELSAFLDLDLSHWSH
jgi:hypothetical protein